MGQYDKTEVICGECSTSIERLKITIYRSIKKNGVYLCPSCANKKATHKKPQCSKDYWTKEKRLKHGEVMKSSEAYYEAIASRPNISKENNPMFGKEHSEESRKKMSKSRIGKTGEDATAWKGGLTSLNRRIRHILHTRYNWYYRVYKRDKFKCTNCGSTKQIDAHHIKPLSLMIRNHLSSISIDSDKEKTEYIVSQPDIKDEDLINGITLCRNCHKEVHKNWGSHNVK